jgi:hypothetical protein
MTRRDKNFLVLKNHVIFLLDDTVCSVFVYLNEHTTEIPIIFLFFNSISNTKD